MTNTELKNGLSAVRGFMQETGIKREGVALYVLFGMDAEETDKIDKIRMEFLR